MVSDDIKRSSTIKFLIASLVIIVLILVLLVILHIIGDKDIDNKENDSNSNSSNLVSENTNYIYKIRYDFGAESYIYLYQDKVIKTEAKVPVIDYCYDTNCMEIKDYQIEEHEVNFSSKVLDDVISVLDELYKRAGKKEFNAAEMELSKYEHRVLLAIMLDLEDSITIQDSIKYINENGKVILDSNVDNKIVKSIANYLNNIVNDIDGDIEIKFMYVGPYSTSFTYAVKDGTKRIIKGYTFSDVGETKDFPGGWKDKYFNKLVDNFSKDELYLEYENKLNKEWKQILKEDMFKEGNWYLGDDEIVFIISPSIIGIDYNSSYPISVELDEEF